jgi:hypothetical protein
LWGPARICVPVCVCVRTREVDSGGLMVNSCLLYVDCPGFKCQLRLEYILRKKHCVLDVCCLCAAAVLSGAYLAGSLFPRLSLYMYLCVVYYKPRPLIVWQRSSLGKNFAVWTRTAEKPRTMKR